MSICTLHLFVFWGLNPNRTQKSYLFTGGSLAALGESDGDFQGFVVAEHGDVYDGAHFATAQCIGEIVEVVDGLAGEIEADVSGVQAGLWSGGAGPDSAEPAGGR